MPIDLADIDPHIVVHDRGGTPVPFSRGVLATSLLATGITGDEADRLASLVQARLLHHDRHDLVVSEVVELTRLTLVEHAADPIVARRWSGWQRAKQTPHPIVIVLGGAPGVGKSIFATRLAVRLGITEVVNTVVVREVLRLAVPPTVLPELHRSTYDLARESAAALQRQCDSVAAATAAVVDGLVADGRSVIVEGLHLFPGSMTAHLARHEQAPAVVERVITIEAADEHSEHLVENSVRDPDDLHTIRSIQHLLVDRAHHAGVRCITRRDTADLTQDTVDDVIALLGT